MCAFAGIMLDNRQVLFVQGGGPSVHDEWDSKLVDSLARGLGPNYEVRYPRMPNEHDPSYARWKPAIEREVSALRDGSILVGHSIGGTMLIKALADLPPPPSAGAIVLIAAPFVGQGGWPGDEFELPSDLGTRLAPGVPVHIFHGSADDTAPATHADLYGRVIPQAQVHRLLGRDHQLNNELDEVADVIRALG